MTSKQFLLYFFAVFGTLGLAVVSFNVYMDIYGVFRPTAGRALPIYGEERIGKYLHSLQYVTSNFDGVLLGSSVSDNLDPRDFRAYGIYNASINGGNAADILPIAENIFRSHRLRITIICIHRYLTNDSINKTDFMSTREYWGALASPQLINAYVSRMAVQHGIVRLGYDQYGTEQPIGDVGPDTVRKRIEETLQDLEKGTAAVGNYSIDPVAFQQLGEVIQLARRGSDRVVIMYPPLPQPILRACSKQLAAYQQKIARLVAPTDLVVDFNSPAYESFRSDPRNFVDAVHLSKVGAKIIMSDLSEAVIAGQPPALRTVEFH